MDGRTLMEIMQSPNFSMWGPSEQAFNLSQKKNEADLQTALGTEQRAKALHPLEVQSKQASIRQSDAAAGYNNALAGKLQDELKILQQVPVDERVRTHVAKLRSELAGDTVKQADSEMEQLLGAAAAAAKNGGQLPLGYTLQNPQHATYFKTPKGAQLAMQIAKEYFMTKPKEMYAASNDARQAASAANVATIGANARVAAAEKAAQRARLKPPKNNLEAVYYYQELARTADTPEEAAQHMAKVQEAQKAYEEELVKKAVLAAQQRMAGNIDLGAAAGGQVPTNPLPGVPTPSIPVKPKGDGSKDNPIVLR